LKQALLGILLLAIVATFAWWHSDRNSGSAPERSPGAARSIDPQAYSKRTWGNPKSLGDHFARHGRDFGAKDANDYARMAYEFFQRAQKQGLPMKVDGAGVYRVYDPGSGAFGAYNANGTTKTFFKPGSAAYFERQPGHRVDFRRSSR
jgi:hypothetical protein